MRQAVLCFFFLLTLSPGRVLAAAPDEAAAPNIPLRGITLRPFAAVPPMAWPGR